jgi:hypothetical protein
MSEETKTYPMDAHCQNCGDAYQVQIPVGMTVEIYRYGTLCRSCKCGTLTIKPVWRFR